MADVARKQTPDGAALMERLGDADYQRLFDFEGYGPSTAPYIFVGLQEVVRNNKQPPNLYTRMTNLRFHQRPVDMWPALDALIEAGGVTKSRAGFDKIDQWGIAARVVAGLEGTETKSEYENLGSTKGITWLTEALPVPMASNSEAAWKAVPIPDRLKRPWVEYRAHEFQRTRRRLRNAVEAPAPPKAIVAYGWDIASELADEFKIEHAHTAVRAGRPLLFAARVQQTVVVGTPFFSDRPGLFGRKDVHRIVDVVHRV